MITTGGAEIPLFEWVAFFVGMPLLYLLTGVLDRLLSLAVGIMRRQLRRNDSLPNPRVLRPPFQLLLLALVIRWLISKFPLPLLARQFWSSTALMIVVVACICVLMLLNEVGERYLVRHQGGTQADHFGLASGSTVDRRAYPVWFVITLLHFGINLTATLAGLGVGGIAVALAAQKTLENVIAGFRLSSTKRCVLETF